MSESFLLTKCTPLCMQENKYCSLASMLYYSAFWIRAKDANEDPFVQASVD